MKALDQQAEDNSAHYRRALDEGWLPKLQATAQEISLALGYLATKDAGSSPANV